MPKASKKHQLTTANLLKVLRQDFDKIKLSESTRKKQISLSDCLSTSLAIFKLKCPSLLQFDTNFRQAEPRSKNLKTLFSIKQIPSDTYLREKLDEVAPSELRKAFTNLFSLEQRSKGLEKYAYLDGQYLLSIDGTGMFSSEKVHCPNCCEKNHKNGKTTYYHQMLGCSIVHPSDQTVIPLCPEPIKKEDGSNKNDCEQNASKRFIENFRREHPHLKVIIVEDALSSNGPHLTLLKDKKCSFITVVKPSSNKILFENVKGLPRKKITVQAKGRAKGLKKKMTTHSISYINEIPLNATYKDFMVNLLEYTELDENGDKCYYNSFITDIEITDENAYELAIGGRTRWRIENNVFNTLKNQGYQFEHNFGHGYKNLNTIFGMLMFLAFSVDQIEERMNPLFQEALQSRHGRKSYLWEYLKSLFFMFIVLSWEDMYRAAITDGTRDFPVLDSS